MEEAESPEAGATSMEATAVGAVDPTAMALALGGASRAEADAFLKHQRALIADQQSLVRLQAKELAHELKLRHWSLQLRHASAILKFAFEVSIALMAVALACLIGAVVWNAANADGLIVDSFSVPPDLVARGLTGEVMASRILDRLVIMQNSTASVRPPQSFADQWGDDIKVEIPETGVSFGEMYRYLKEWLGHETHVGGDVTRTDKGIALTARVSGSGAASFAETETGLDNLIEKAAEDIYERIQPYRYGVYLRGHGRREEALAKFQHLATAGPEAERPWGYVGWGLTVLENGAPTTAVSLFERAAETPAVSTLAFADLVGLEIALGRPERALRDAKQAESNIDRGGISSISAQQMAGERGNAEARTDALKGDFQKAAQEWEDTHPISRQGVGFFMFSVAEFEAQEHDLAAANLALAKYRVFLANSSVRDVGIYTLLSFKTQFLIDSQAQDWAGLISRANGIAPIAQKSPANRAWSLTVTVPLTAYAEAKLGNISLAESEIAPTPADCYDCLIARARIAGIEGQQPRADWWFDRAVRSNPTIPFAYHDWGRAFLARGDAAAAIAKFKLANEKGPHFADPLEGWGEALMALNRSDLALAKFAEAEKYAPKWGRLHLKWGETLVYAGKKDEAKKQFALAATLDLTPEDKDELARAPHG